MGLVEWVRVFFPPIYNCLCSCSLFFSSCKKSRISLQPVRKAMPPWLRTETFATYSWDQAASLLCANRDVIYNKLCRTNGCWFVFLGFFYKKEPISWGWHRTIRYGYHFSLPSPQWLKQLANWKCKEASPLIRLTRRKTVTEFGGEKMPPFIQVWLVGFPSHRQNLYFTSLGGKTCHKKIKPQCWLDAECASK